MSGVTVSTQVGLGDLLPLFEQSSLEVHILRPLRRVMVPLDKFTAILMTEMQIGSWEIQLTCKRSKTGKITTMIKGHAETAEEAIRIAEGLAESIKPDLVLEAGSEPPKPSPALGDTAEE
jgi:hypothetical protein